MSDWYFAYGSNMNTQRMNARGLEYKQAIAGVLPGYQLRFNKRAQGKTGVAYANIAYQPQSRVEGVLYQLDNPTSIELMDPFEGSPVRYSREIYAVAFATEQRTINAWVYVANPAMLAEGLLPESNYLQHLLAGKAFYSNEYHRRLLAQAVIASTPAAGLKDGLKFNV